LQGTCVFMSKGDEAQYWLEMSKKQKNVYPYVKLKRFDKFDHLAEFGPTLSANVYEKNLHGKTIVAMKGTGPLTPSPLHSSSHGEEYTDDAAKINFGNDDIYNVEYDAVGIPVDNRENPFFNELDSEYFVEAPPCVETTVENPQSLRNIDNYEEDETEEDVLVQFPNRSIKEGDTPVESPIATSNNSENIKEDDAEESRYEYPIARSNMKNVILDIPISTSPGVSLLNPARPILSPADLASPDILKHGYKRDYSVPSVSKILAATMSEKSKEVLARWEKEKIALLGLEGFKKLKADTFARGHTLHSMLETFMESRKLPKASSIPDSVSKRHLVSISQAVKQFHTPLLLESAVTHPDLGYGGIVDCAAVLGDTLVLVDWKTSEKVKNNVSDLYDNPLQVAAYMGALNRDERYSHLGNICNGAVVVVYNSGYPAMVHMFNQEQMEMYWEKWCDRVEMFKKM